MTALCSPDHLALDQKSRLCSYTPLRESLLSDMALFKEDGLKFFHDQNYFVP